MNLARSSTNPSPDVSPETAAEVAAPAEESHFFDIDASDLDVADMPSFRSLRSRRIDALEPLDGASAREARSKAPVGATVEARAIARSSGCTSPVAKQAAPPPDQGAPDRVPASRRRSRRPLLACCVFISGVAAGIGGACLTGSAVGLQDLRTAVSSMSKTVAGAIGAITMTMAPSERPFLRSAPADPPRLPDPVLLPHDPALSDGTLRSAGDAASGGGELAARIDRAERHIAAPRLETPPADNAPETIHQPTAILPSAAVSPLDQRLERTLSPNVHDAIASGHSDEARPSVEIPRRLPTSPIDQSGAVPRDSVGPDATDNEAPAPTPRPADVASAALVRSAGHIASSSEDEAEALATFGLMRGDEATARGDIVAARRFYELAAANRSAPAATAVGRTYDPNYLKELGVRGLPPDPGKARYWYEKAQQQGDGEARARLARLLGAMDRTSPRAP